MNMRIYFLGLALMAVAIGRAAAPVDPPAHGKTIRVKTDTCIAFDVEEILGPAGATSAFAVAGVWVLPTPDSKFFLATARSLVGAAVTGVTITTKGWHVSVEVSHLTIKPRNAAAPLTNAELAFVLELEVASAISTAIRYRTLPPDTVAPVVSAAGLSSGTGSIVGVGRGATMLFPLTGEERDRETARQAAAKAQPAGGR